MATAAEILDLLAITDNSLRVGSGQGDEVRAIAALNAAQDLLDNFCVREAKLINAVTSVNTAANTLTTAFPTGMLRINDIQATDAAGNLSYVLTYIRQVGGHAGASVPWPLVVLAPTPAKPTAYTITSKTVRWSPTPDAIYAMLFYGFISGTNFASRSTTFSYDDLAMLPMALVAGKILKLGLDADTAELTAFAGDCFGPAIKAMKSTVRSKGTPRQYSQVHTT